AFYDAIKDARYEICADRRWDAMIDAGPPPAVVFDESLLELLAAQLASLILGQSLATDYGASVTTLSLHATLMRHTLSQNLEVDPLTSMPDMVNKTVGKPVDINKYLNDTAFQTRFTTGILTTLYFLVFHEFCHIAGPKSGTTPPSVDGLSPEIQ